MDWIGTPWIAVPCAAPPSLAVLCLAGQRNAKPGQARDRRAAAGCAVLRRENHDAFAFLMSSSLVYLTQLLTTNRPNGPFRDGRNSPIPILDPMSSTNFRTIRSSNIASSTWSVNLSRHASKRGRWHIIRPPVDGITTDRLSTSHCTGLPSGCSTGHSISPIWIPAGTKLDFPLVIGRRPLLWKTPASINARNTFGPGTTGLPSEDVYSRGSACSRGVPRDPTVIGLVPALTRAAASSVKRFMSSGLTPCIAISSLDILATSGS